MSKSNYYIRYVKRIKHSVVHCMSRTTTIVGSSAEVGQDVPCSFAEPEFFEGYPEDNEPVRPVDTEVIDSIF